LKRSGVFEEHVRAAATFIERVREQYPDIVFVLIFDSAANRDEFFQIAGNRFAYYLTMIADSVERELPDIFEKCQVWLSRRRESKTISKQVFMCHSSGDKIAVRELSERLKRDGSRPWLDEEAILPGQEWQTEITKAVRASDVIIVCLSKASINKEGFVQREIRVALDVADEKPEGRFSSFR
jgi:hypothetical protein